jgi:hypothetical protein
MFIKYNNKIDATNIKGWIEIYEQFSKSQFKYVNGIILLTSK